MTTITNRLFAFGDVATGIAAAGTTQATATPCTAAHVTVESGTEAQGVLLQIGNSGDLRTVANHNAAASIKVYPPTGAAFNGAAANAALSIPANHAALFLFVTTNKITMVVW